MDLAIEEFIDVTIETGEHERKMIDMWRDYIMSEIRAKKLVFEKPRGYIKEWDIDGSKVVIGIERA